MKQLFLMMDGLIVTMCVLRMAVVQLESFIIMRFVTLRTWLQVLEINRYIK